MHIWRFLTISIVVIVVGCQAKSGGEGSQAGNFPDDVPNDFTPLTFKPEATKRVVKDVGPLAEDELVLGGEKWKRTGPENNKSHKEIPVTPGESGGIKHDFGGTANVDIFSHPSDPERRVAVLKMVPFPDGEPTASWTKVLIEQKRVNGDWINHGSQEEYFDSGKIMESTYVDGVLHGWQRYYFPSGQLEQETPWIKGQKQGRGRWLYESGIRRAEYIYKNDDKVKSRDLPEKKGESPKRG